MADEDVKRDDNRVTGLLAENESGETKPLVVTDATQRLKVDIGPGGSAGTQYDAGDVAGATDTGTAALVVRDDVLSTLTQSDGDYTFLRVSSTGALHVTGGGGGTEYNTNDATPDPVVGTATLMERDDAITTVTPIEGDFIRQRGTAEGALWTQDFNSDAILANTGTIAGAVAGSEMQTDIVAPLPAGTNAIGKLSANSGVDIGDVDVTSVVPGSGATNLGKAEDAAHGSGDTGVMSLAVRNDAASALAGNGDYIPLTTDSAGRLYVRLTQTNLDIRDLVPATDIVSAEGDGTALGNGQITADTTAGGVTVLAASAGRAGVTITNQGAIAAYVGTGTVSSSNGFLLNPGESLAMPTDSEIKAIAASSSTTIGYLSYA